MQSYSYLLVGDLFMKKFALLSLTTLLSGCMLTPEFIKPGAVKMSTPAIGMPNKVCHSIFYSFNEKGDDIDGIGPCTLHQEDYYNVSGIENLNNYYRPKGKGLIKVSYNKESGNYEYSIYGGQERWMPTFTKATNHPLPNYVNHKIRQIREDILEAYHTKDYTKLLKLKSSPAISNIAFDALVGSDKDIPSFVDFMHKINQPIELQAAILITASTKAFGKLKEDYGFYYNTVEEFKSSNLYQHLLLNKYIKYRMFDNQPEIYPGFYTGYHSIRYLTNSYTVSIYISNKGKYDCKVTDKKQNTESALGFFSGPRLDTYETTKTKCTTSASFVNEMNELLTSLGVPSDRRYETSDEYTDKKQIASTKDTERAKRLQQQYEEEKSRDAIKKLYKVEPSYDMFGNREKDKFKVTCLAGPRKGKTSVVFSDSEAESHCNDY